MKKQCKLSNVTTDYLVSYRNILDEMIDSMTGVGLTDSISNNFIVQMIPHHKAAIEMSENLLKYTTCIPLQDIAENIIVEQTKSIQDMLDIECSCMGLENDQQELCMYQQKMDEIMDNMFMSMENACSTNQINANFIREMIPHHRGAVLMSKTTLQYDICPELVPILNAIIQSQERGIVKMQRLLRCVSD